MGSIDSSGRYVPTAAGTWEVSATVSGITGRTFVTVLPGNLSRIDVSPKNQTITTDQQLRFTATGYDIKGNVVEMSPAWDAEGGGEIDSSGNYNPERPGKWRIYANASGISGFTYVYVVEGSPSRIEITPERAQVRAGETVKFEARIYDADGNAVTGYPIWSAEEGEISEGTYTATKAGTWKVYANISGIIGDWAEVEVLPGQPSVLEISPKNVTITAGESARFTASVWDAYGNPTDAAVSWYCTVGNITGGMFSGTEAGTWRIYANITLNGTEISDYASVTVLPGPLHRVDINTDSIVLDPGQSFTFSASCRDEYGNVVPGVHVIWTVEGDIGTIQQNGMFTAGEHPGTGKVVVTATHKNITVSSSADVEIAGAAPSKVKKIHEWVYGMYGILIASLLASGAPAVYGILKN